MFESADAAVAEADTFTRPGPTATGQLPGRGREETVPCSPWTRSGGRPFPRLRPALASKFFAFQN